MDILSAISVTLRVTIILLACAMVIGWWRPLLAVLLRQPGWRGHLSSFVATALAVGGAVISSVNIFPDAGWTIPRDLRLLVVNLGLAVFCVGLLTSIYRRALRSGPDKARCAFLSGLAFIIPGVGLVALLTIGGGQ